MCKSVVWRFCSIIVLILVAACGDGKSLKPVPLFSVSGAVSGAASSGVTVTLVAGTTTTITTTDANGNFSFPSVPNGVHTVTPTSPSNTFAPTSTAVTVNNGNVANINFAAAPVIAPTYSISGTITGAPNVTVTLAGPTNGSMTTDANGNYSFSGLANGPYTVTPTSLGNTFAPTSTAVTVSNANVANINFTATAITYGVSGAVSGAISSGVVITLGGPSVGSTTTDANGTFSFANLQNGSYTITPTAPGYSFNPTSTAVTVSNANVANINFTATAIVIPTYTVSGNITGASNVTVTLTGTANASATTDANGNFSFAGLANGGYTITPTAPSYSFSPTSTAVTVNGGNVSSTNFTATAIVVPTYSVSGNITGASNVTVTMTGTANASATTDANGTFSFSGLQNGPYTITPTAPGYSFSPTSTVVTVNNGNATNTNFTATAILYNIAGTVGGVNPSGIVITLDGPSVGSMVTDVNGNFSFTGFQNGTYTVVPSSIGLTFNPTSLVVNVSNGNVTGVNFTAAAIVYSISGAVAGAPDVTVTMTGPTSGSTTTDANGGYSFSGLQNGTYTVVPSSIGLTFNPTSLVVNVSNGNVTGVNFTAAAIVYSISGAVAGAPDVTVTMTGPTNGSTTTDVNGTFSLNGLANGGYTITPTAPGYSFSPTSTAVTVSNGNVTSANFVATAVIVVVPTYTVSGNITGASNVTVTMTGTANASATTDANGTFSFAGLANGTYTITPTAPGYSFSPTSTVVTVSDADVANVNFAVPMLATGKLLYPGQRSVSSKELATGVETVLWGGGLGSPYPETIVPVRDGQSVAFQSSNLGGLFGNIRGIYLLSLSTLTAQKVVWSGIDWISGCSSVAQGSFDLTQSGDVAVFTSLCSSSGSPTKRDVVLMMTDGTMYWSRVTNDDASESSPVIGSAGGANDQLTIYFVSNKGGGIGIWGQIVDSTNDVFVGPQTLFASDVVEGRISVNATYDKMAYARNIDGVPHIVVKPLAGGAEVDLGEGTDPYWSANGIISYFANGLLWAVNSDGTGRKQIPIPSNLGGDTIVNAISNIFLVP